MNVTGAEPLHVESFSTEDGYDKLLVNCKAYSGQRSPEGVVPDSASEAIPFSRWRSIACSTLCKTIGCHMLDIESYTIHIVMFLM